MANMQSTTRTFELDSDGITYFEILTITYDDGTLDISKRLLGDSSVLAETQANNIESIISQLVSGVQSVLKLERVLAESEQTAVEVLKYTSVSPFEILQERYQKEFLSNAWSINNDGAIEDITFNLNGDGDLEYGINGNKGLVNTYGKLIQLTNYPTEGVSTNLFLSEDGLSYFGLSLGTISIQKN